MKASESTEKRGGSIFEIIQVLTDGNLVQNSIHDKSMLMNDASIRFVVRSIIFLYSLHHKTGGSDKS